MHGENGEEGRVQTIVAFGGCGQESEFYSNRSDLCFIKKNPSGPLIIFGQQRKQS